MWKKRHFLIRKKINRNICHYFFLYFCFSSRLILIISFIFYYTWDYFVFKCELEKNLLALMMKCCCCCFLGNTQNEKILPFYVACFCFLFFSKTLLLFFQFSLDHTYDSLKHAMYVQTPFARWCENNIVSWKKMTKIVCL